APGYIPTDIIRKAAAVVASAYPLRATGKPIQQAMLKMLTDAKTADVPVVMSLGTKHLVQEHKQLIRQTLTDYVNVLAMNEQEAEALTGFADPLLAAEAALDYVDM